MSDIPNYAALSIENKQVVNSHADDLVTRLRECGFSIPPFARPTDRRYRATLDAIAAWIPDDDSGPAGDDDAAAAPSLERGRSRGQSDDDEIEAERNRANERGHGGGR